jgi:hypothetical protein
MRDKQRNGYKEKTKRAKIRCLYAPPSHPLPTRNFELSSPWERVRWLCAIVCCNSELSNCVEQWLNSHICSTLGLRAPTYCQRIKWSMGAGHTPIFTLTISATMCRNISVKRRATDQKWVSLFFFSLPRPDMPLGQYTLVSNGWNARTVNVINNLCLEPRLRMRGALPPSLCTPLCRGSHVQI